MGVYIKGMTLKQLKNMGIAGIQLNINRLVEVPEPHGRLIDAEALHRDIGKKAGDPEYQHPGEDWVCGLYIADELLCGQLTVIEAEDETKW